MKKLTIAAMLLALAPAVAAQAESRWQDLLTMSGTKVETVQGATRIDIATAKAMHDENHLFVDVQGHNGWKEGHIPGAIQASYVTEKSLAKIADKDKEIVFYCNCDEGSPTCNRSSFASAQAAALGYAKIYYFTNFEDWKTEGYATDTGG